MESLDPYERSVVLRTRYTIDLEDVDDSVFIPIELAARGRTEDGFQSSIPAPAGYQRLVSAVRRNRGRRDPGPDRFLWAEFPQAVPGAPSAGREVDGGWGAGPARRFPRRDDDDRMRDLQALASLSRNIMGIKARFRHPKNLYLVVRLLHRFHQSHPVTIVVAGDVDSEGVNGKSTQVEVRRRVVPISSSCRPGTIGAWWCAGAEMSSSSSRVGLNKLTSFIRHFFGVRSSALSFPLTNAGRARSYHLEFKGPADTYMARQGFEDLRGSPLGILGEPQESAVSPARGQRHSHLYIRNGDPWLSRVRYRVSYSSGHPARWPLPSRPPRRRC